MASRSGFWKNKASPQPAAFRKVLSNFRLAAQLAPTLSLIVGLYLGGLILALIQSLGYFPAGGLTRFSIDAYRTAFSRPAFWGSLLLTFWVSLVATGLSSLLAICSALLLRRAFKSLRVGKRLVTFLYQLNVPIPHSVGAIGILLLFSQSGWLARLAFSLGQIHDPSEFPALIFDPYGIGIILEYTWKASVFIGVVLLATLETVGDDYEAMAGTLGASAWQRFRYVTFPLLLPALVASSILVFAFSFGGYEVPYLLGQRTISMLPVLAYRTYSQGELTDRPEAMAISIFISAVVLVLVWIYMRLSEQ